MDLSLSTHVSITIDLTGEEFRALLDELDTLSSVHYHERPRLTQVYQALTMENNR